MSRTAKWILGIGVALCGFIALFVISVLSIMGTSDDSDDVPSFSGDRVALVELNEPIYSSGEIVRQLKKYRHNRGVKAIVFRIESPGGGVSASQEIYEEVKKTRDSGTPVVVSMGSVAASGGYYVACGADKIVANPGTLTGSIGVIFQFLQFEDLMKKLGVEASTFKSGELKDIGSPFRKTTPQERAYFQQLVEDVYQQFVDVVAKERKLKESFVRKYADGRVFSGRQAVAWGFVDTLGTYEDAIAIAGTMGGIRGTPKTIREYKRRTFLQDLMGETVTDLERMKDEFLHQSALQYRMRTPY
ncbi:MAG TPA: signal peptide peptidase SppA [Bacteroidetes bacterium]|nr:MAG: hypothetical protein A2X68_05280 [Ignavibacteria bacterium GWC2_56_12]HAV22612.1 signal peptide peptidase SppA [Bacteroidota bacterium]